MILLTLGLALAAVTILIFLRGALEYYLLRQQYRFIEELLVTWAYDAAPETRAKLLPIIRRYRPELTPKPPEDPQPSVGMDCLVGPLIAALWARYRRRGHAAVES